ncbi:hypothetical protein [Arthrobacter bambusae]|uniref:Uncharacterized protein n=1 Tax=Arthrobacter bambusae TaxID=1338426 RepID=A0AAW8DEJ4_9MICC|nr:hypothetical protein [Arthrobacter bambusae]MDP9904695.1 hypothetical protein [Arthrobacter bambusae]MDQ0129511.1 hypothetical protein [Arthrobacter bambusae]MDQ0180876.1 hypothetical protein [Arthrobacter bambusae]
MTRRSENTLTWLAQHRIEIPAPFTRDFLAHQDNDHIEDNTRQDLPFLLSGRKRSAELIRRRH